MGRLSLLLAFHNHQPVGNFGDVFRQSHDRCYAPLLHALADAPHVRCALHHTGALLDWLESEEPGYLKTLRALVERGQVEILGGGLYEPMLAVLPERDALAQIAAMGERCARLFGTTPLGMWLAERVWDPDLPRVLAAAGIRYTLLDDTHFHAAGVGAGGERLGGYYLSEKAGAAVALFPIDKELRYSIPFRAAPELCAALRDAARAAPGETALTYGDDGEKFGVWPGTAEWVWEKGWLRDFFAGLADVANDVVTAPPGDWLARAAPRGRVYLPTASYEEMGEWSLPARAIPAYLRLRHDLEARGELEAARAFVRGGIWQGFLAKYAEANWMHKRMLQVSARYAARGLPPPESLMRSQCNCAYWHGMFGGLYLSNLRHAVYASLIEAEAQIAPGASAADDAGGEGGSGAGGLGVSDGPGVGVGGAGSGVGAGGVRGGGGGAGESVGKTAALRDLDLDGRPERVLASDALLVVADALSGVVKEIDVRFARFNLTNVLARREEGYHATLRRADAEAQARAEAASRAQARTGSSDGGDGGRRDGGPGAKSIHDVVKMKEPNLSRFLRQDDAPRHSFRLRRILPGTDLDAVERGDGAPLPAPQGAALKDEMQFAAALAVVGPELRATFHAPPPAPGAGRWAVELNLTLLTPDAPDRKCFVPGGDDTRPGARAVTPGAQGFRLEDGWARFAATVHADGAEALWRYPIETVSQSEDGFERTYQGSCFLLVFPAGAAPSIVTLRVEVLP
ncbi:MAG TPA: alpha-amylase/4-alpha-glucanotransferase domain-containing protein [Myxococcota bacterium]|jgi:alpha-amylase|nr:alpha-amylase/4-alpha-glucanotransferase domain-containing protein [Myxococcota bacterium]